MANNIVFSKDVPQSIPQGNYVFDVKPGNGTVTLQIDGGNGYGAVANGSFTNATTDGIYLPNCMMKAGLTGNATFELFQ